MADDDFDLDAILDSTLDEEFATPTTTAGVADDDCDLDLDAMLDEAIVSVAPDPADGEVAQQKRQGTDTVKSSGGSGSRGTGGSRGSANDPLSFLRPDRRQAWNAALAEDAQRQADMSKQRPLSRAYRSFYSTGKEDGGIVVHMGSGASTTKASSDDASSGGPSRGGVDGGVGDEGNGRADDIFEDILAKAVTSSDVAEPPSISEGDSSTLDRLKASYLRLVAKDVRSRVSKDPDLSAERFPSIASKILV